MTSWNEHGIPRNRRSYSMDEVRQMYEESTEFIFTFGFSHKDPRTGDPLAGKFVRVAGNYTTARERMELSYGYTGWSMQYANEDLAGVEDHGLIEVPLPPPRFTRHQGVHDE